MKTMQIQNRGSHKTIVMDINNYNSDNNILPLPELPDLLL